MLRLLVLRQTFLSQSHYQIARQYAPSFCSHSTIILEKCVEADESVLVVVMMQCDYV